MDLILHYFMVMAHMRTCKDNSDRTFADCSIPQEKTNAEINGELDISEASGEENSSSAKPKPKGIENTKSMAYQRPSRARIKCNLFLHRSRKTQTVDEFADDVYLPPDEPHGTIEASLSQILSKM